MRQLWERARCDLSHEDRRHGLRDKDVGRQAVRCWISQGESVVV